VIQDGKAGIDCINCGHQEIATNEDESELLSKSLHWAENGDAVCPECGHTVTYEHYISE